MQNSPMNNAEWNDGGTKGRRDEGVVNNCRWRGSGLAAGTCQIGRRNAVRARRVSGGNREQGTGNRVPGTGNRKAATSPRHCRGMRGGNMQKGRAAEKFPMAGVGIRDGALTSDLPAGGMALDLPALPPPIITLPRRTVNACPAEKQFASADFVMYSYRC